MTPTSKLWSTKHIVNIIQRIINTLNVSQHDIQVGKNKQRCHLVLNLNNPDNLDCLSTGKRSYLKYVTR